MGLRKTPHTITCDKANIKKLYKEGKLSIKEIAKLLELDYGTVLYYMQTRGIPRRSQKEGRALFDKKNPNFFTGENNPYWKPRIDNYLDQCMDEFGYIYVYVPSHHRALKSRGYYAPLHIIAWEQANHQLVSKGWMVHHLNGVKNDNRPCNLEAMLGKKHDRLIPTLQKRIRELEVLLNKKLFPTSKNV